ncbi:hypothetical protein D5R40_30885 [Okeania hirsuta]|uniref:Uncharacterized protein n=1 Tax=Okeania hirsuta TaxID=1458930 RepID=A0A3N6P5V8_9CYAN|nr:hypothetical protein D5R40_30885 [Okeania hirsuta]
MIRQAFKLIWNQRGKTLRFVVEIFFSFMVLFLVFSFGILQIIYRNSSVHWAMNTRKFGSISLNREGMEHKASLQVSMHKLKKP